MSKAGEYISLEQAVNSLKQTAPEVLAALSSAIGAVDPNKRFDHTIINGSKYGKSIPNFSLTYGQLSAYIENAVQKRASVLVETGVGVIESARVSVSLAWLVEQHTQASRQPEVIRAKERKAYLAQGSTVTPILPPLQDQPAAEALAELSRVKARIARHLVIRPDDERDRQIEELRASLSETQSALRMAFDEKATLLLSVKMLTIENDQLRKARAPADLGSGYPQPSAVKKKPSKPSNVEVFNETQRATRRIVADHARSLWRHEDFAGYRTMDMVKFIRRLAETQEMGDLPETDEVLARWLSEDAAPTFAKRPGRPRKPRSKK